MSLFVRILSNIIIFDMIILDKYSIVTPFMSGGHILGETTLPFLLHLFCIRASS